MWRGLFLLLLVACSGWPWNDAPLAQENSVIELSAPRSPRPDEAVEIQIVTGPLPRGARLSVMTEQGEVLGSVAPFVLPGDEGGSSATIPVPRGMLVDGRLRLRLQVVQPGAASRTPSADEIRRMDLIIVPGNQ
jgi:hypothetical protein